MLHFLSTLSLTIVLSVGLSACDSAGGGDDSATSGMMKARVDGSAFDASLAVVVSNSGGIVAVTGSDDQSRQVQITMKALNGTGTFSIDSFIGGTNFARYTGGTDPSETYNTLQVQAGTLTVTEFSSDGIAGTFSFTARNSASNTVPVSDGEFESNFE